MSNSYRPYKYSKKAGRYVSTTKKNNREYYYDILNEVVDVDFDPNSTYGRYILKKIVPDLKFYRKSKSSLKETELNLHRAELNFKSQIRKKEEEVKMSYSLLLRNKKRELAALKNKLYLLLFYKNRYLLTIGLLAVIIFYFLPNHHILLKILFFYLSFALIDGVKEKIEKSFDVEAKNLVDKEQVFKTLRDFESELINNMNSFKDEIISEKETIMIYINSIREEVNILLNDKYVGFILSDGFYKSTDWRKIRDEAMRTKVNECVMCRSTNDLTVDHIKPRSKYPKIALDISNTQILCRTCNSSKGNR